MHHKSCSMSAQLFEYTTVILRYSLELLNNTAALREHALQDDVLLPRTVRSRNTELPDSSHLLLPESKSWG